MPRKTFTFEGRRYDVTAPTESELAVKIAMKKRDLDEGKKRISRNMLVREWFRHYIETYKSHSVSAETLGGIAGRARNWIYPAIGNMQMKDVKKSHCQNILNSLSGGSKSQADKVRQLLRGAFEEAVEDGLVYQNPARRLTMPKTKEGTRRALTGAERRALLKVCETHRHGLWALAMLYAGMRPSETARMIGKHIDINGLKLFIDGTKTKGSKRVVPIPANFAAMLREAAARPFDHVFVNGQGRPLTKSNMRRMWKAIIRAMNIEMGCIVFRNEIIPPFAVAADLTAYCLRHTYATDLEAAGVSINVSMRFLGHTRVSTTQLYTHESAAAFENARRLIEKRAADGAAKTGDPPFGGFG